MCSNWIGPAAGHAAHFLANAPDNVGPVREDVEGPRQRARARLVPGQEHHAELVDQLLAAEAGAIGIARHDDVARDVVEAFAIGAQMIGQHLVEVMADRPRRPRAPPRFCGGFVQALSMMRRRISTCATLRSNSVNASKTIREASCSRLVENTVRQMTSAVRCDIARSRLNGACALRMLAKEIDARLRRPAPSTGKARLTRIMLQRGVEHVALAPPGGAGRDEDAVADQRLQRVHHQVGLREDAFGVDQHVAHEIGPVHEHGRAARPAQRRRSPCDRPPRAAARADCRRRARPRAPATEAPAGAADAADDTSARSCQNCPRST